MRTAARMRREDVNDQRATNADASERKVNYFDYFTEVEDYFLRRRGKTLLLSPIDWALIESWKQKGVPLHVVLRGVGRTFDSFDKKPPGARKRSIKTLLYCEEEVEAQYAEWLESQIGKGSTTGATGDGTSASAGDTTVRSDAANVEAADAAFSAPAVRAHLTSRRDALAELCAAGTQNDVRLSPAMCETIERVVRRLDELRDGWQIAAQPSAERLEDALTQLEKLLDEHLPTCFTTKQLSDEQRHAQTQLAAYKTRMEPDIYRTTFANLLLKRLRERCGIPRLSLFYL